MSLVVKLIISGWLTTFATIGFCALNESGTLRNIGKRMALWLETSAPDAEGRLQPDSENIA
jgi:hypothetical protein